MDFVTKFLPKARRSKAGQIREDSDRAQLFRPLSEERKEFRVLTVLPGESDAPLICTLDRVSLHDAARYETISYCWGRTQAQHTISVSGLWINVPYTAAGVLARVRLADSSRTVWLDAICIDQCSLAERNQQVLLMADIYKNGYSNIVWLGHPVKPSFPATHNPNRTVQFVEQGVADLALEMMQATIGHGNASDNLMDETGAIKVADKPWQGSYTLEYMMRLFEQPWFGRIW
jgi:hypothetical protein